MTDLTHFWYDLEKKPAIISLLLENGVVVSGKFSNPRRAFTTVGSEGAKVAVGDFLLKSVTIVHTCGDVARLPELIVPKETIVCWGVGKLTPAQTQGSGDCAERDK